MAEETQQQREDEGKAKKRSRWFKFWEKTEKLHPSDQDQEKAIEWAKNFSLDDRVDFEISSEFKYGGWKIVIDRMHYYSIERFNQVTTRHDNVIMVLSIILTVLTATMLARMLGLL